MRTSNTLNAPPQTQTSATNNPQLRNKQLKILQINVNGIQNKTVELQQLLTQENIDILTIQETKLNSTNKTPQFPHYSATRKDNTSKSGGGLLTYVKDNITFRDAPPPPTTSTNLIETQAIKINISTNHTLTIFNNYIPPRNPSTNTQSEDDAITDLLTHLTDTPNSVITGTPQSLITLPPSSNPPPTRSSTETHTQAYHQIKINNQPHQTSQQYHPNYSTKHNGKPRQHSTQTIYPSSSQSTSHKTFDSNKHPKPLPTTRKQLDLF